MDSRTYWRKREERWIKEQIQSDIELKKKINDLMNDAFDEVQQDIDSFYAKYATAEGISIQITSDVKLGLQYPTQVPIVLKPKI